MFFFITEEERMEAMDAKHARIMIWEELRKVARPDSRFSWDFGEFIADYEGSDKGAELLAQQDFYRNAEVIFITPDNNLEKLREIAFRDRKTVLMTNYGITRGVFLIAPGMIPEGKEELASTLDGVQRFWKHLTLREVKERIGHIDLMVTGASAINMRGVRFGKGHGYFDLEWAMFSTIGAADDRTVIATAGHDCQVVDIEVDVQPYDTAFDWIITPTRVIKTRNEFPRPSCGVIWSLLEPGMKGAIPPLQELWNERFCR